MRNDLNNFNGLALGIMIVVFIIAMAFVWTSLVEQEKAYNCNEIHNNSEYKVEELSKAGCFDDLDFINNL